jgi:hypothetical protein
MTLAGWQESPTSVWLGGHLKGVGAATDSDDVAWKSSGTSERSHCSGGCQVHHGGGGCLGSSRFAPLQCSGRGLILDGHSRIGSGS